MDSASSTASIPISNPPTRNAAATSLQEYVDAVRAEGLKVGLYFSARLVPRRFPTLRRPEPPMRNNPAYKNDDRDFDRYLTYMHNQVGEICTNYGKLDAVV